MNMLVSVASVASVVPIVVTEATQPDPIFAAIEAHKRTNAGYAEAIHRVSAYQDSHRGAGRALPRAKDHPELAELQQQQTDAADADNETASSLLSTVPTTLAGIAALVRYAEEQGDELGEHIISDADDEEGQGYDALLTTLSTALAAHVPATTSPVAIIEARSSAIDPIFAAIERVRDLNMTLKSLSDPDNAWEARSEADEPAHKAAHMEIQGLVGEVLANTVPTTPAGLAELTAFLRDASAHHFGLNHMDGSRGLHRPAASYLFEERPAGELFASLDTAVRGMARLKPWKGVAPTEPDPIFAAIEKHRAAWRAYGAACNDQSRLEESLPPDDTRWCPRRDDLCAPPPDGTHTDWARVVIANWAAWDAHLDATLEMIDIAPTTIAGAIELLRYFHDHVSAGYEWPDDFVDDVDDPDAEKRPCSWFLHRHVAEALTEIANAAA